MMTTSKCTLAKKLHHMLFQNTFFLSFLREGALFYPKGKKCVLICLFIWKICARSHTSDSYLSLQQSLEIWNS